MQQISAFDPSQEALFLDFDGTLVDFADDPAKVFVKPDVSEHLARLQAATSGALAIVSGRPIADLDSFLKPLRFCAAGVHGWELRTEPDGQVQHLATPEALATVRQKLQEAVQRDGYIQLEDKGTALVLHYRTVPERRAQAEAIMQGAVAGQIGFKVMSGHCVIEVHKLGMDKGAALDTLMQHAPFVGRRPVYIGDDTTDEYAFAALSRWGGRGFKVGNGTTAAQARLADVAAVHTWLGKAGLAQTGELS
ncbi:trehalose-phosphatase [Aureimonas fodinaquatilis]|uniref:Trehalose 6-phosphate phosphatase n=1 Tax=Aureimonas fodinaquatilis TaxID=2565783 RepID=A0A5B0E1D7_9HYPH|nr:trehalose-phosphatase [Aureimonas fodinaquatilis]KAA0972112.1 trehalose-phosphatase [Aureimonas fodinaquatilis]